MYFVCEIFYYGRQNFFPLNAQVIYDLRRQSHMCFGPMVELIQPLFHDAAPKVHTYTLYNHKSSDQPHPPQSRAHQASSPCAVRFRSKLFNQSRVQNLIWYSSEESSHIMSSHVLCHSDDDVEKYLVTLSRHLLQSRHQRKSESISFTEPTHCDMRQREAYFGTL